MANLLSVEGSEDAWMLHNLLKAHGIDSLVSDAKLDEAL